MSTDSPWPRTAASPCTCTAITTTCSPKPRMAGRSSSASARRSISRAPDLAMPPPPRARSRPNRPWSRLVPLAQQWRQFLADDLDLLRHHLLWHAGDRREEVHVLDGRIADIALDLLRGIRGCCQKKRGLAQIAAAP